MSFTVAIDVADPAWRTLVPGLDGLVERTVAAVGDALGPRRASGEISLVFADDAFVRGLNAAHRGRDAPTNVLSFPNGFDDDTDASAPRLVGDVVLARETIAREAAEQAKPVADHVAHLLAHGVLHLCGWDHETADQARAMEAIEVALLARLGVPDPYRAAVPDEEAAEPA